MSDLYNLEVTILVGKVFLEFSKMPAKESMISKIPKGHYEIENI